MDSYRAASYTIANGVLIGPVLHWWYSLLRTQYPGPGMGALVRRVATDQFIFAPLIIPAFLSTILTLQGRPSDVPATLRAEWLNTLMNNWGLWIPAQFVNFYFVPARLQVIFSQATGLVWNCYLSYVSFKARSAERSDLRAQRSVATLPVAAKAADGHAAQVAVLAARDTDTSLRDTAERLLEVRRAEGDAGEGAEYDTESQREQVRERLEDIVRRLEAAAALAAASLAPPATAAQVVTLVGPDVAMEAATGIVRNAALVKMAAGGAHMAPGSGGGPGRAGRAEMPDGAAVPEVAPQEGEGADAPVAATATRDAEGSRPPAA